MLLISATRRQSVEMSQPGKSATSISSESQLTRPRKGPLSYLSGALTSATLTWLSFGVSQRMVTYFAAHPPDFNSAIGQTIASALRTLLTGMCFLATFSFAFVGLGLSLIFLRSIFAGGKLHET